MAIDASTNYADLNADNYSFQQLPPIENVAANTDEQEVANRGGDDGEGTPGVETEAGYEDALNTFKETTALAVERNLEMMTVQVDYGTWLSAAKMRVNPV